MWSEWSSLNFNRIEFAYPLDNDKTSMKRHDKSWQNMTRHDKTWQGMSSNDDFAYQKTKQVVSQLYHFLPFLTVNVNNVHKYKYCQHWSLDMRPPLPSTHPLRENFLRWHNFFPFSSLPYCRLLMRNTFSLLWLQDMSHSLHSFPFLSLSSLFFSLSFNE